ncbi:MAG: hypothetical protein EBV15_09990 [Bacteroidetes bacterium]|nr:hypothetical protein [Bacteroidota bacterium]
MENKVSEKIRLMLNELAILNQPEQTENKILYRHEDLLKIRSLAAELYINSDLALQGNEVPELVVTPAYEPLSEEVKPEPEILEQEVIEAEETPVFAEEIPVQVSVEPLIEEPEPEIIPEPVFVPPSPVEEVMVETPPVIIPEPEVTEIPAEDPIQTELPLDAQIDTHEPSEELQEQHDFKPPRITSEQIASQISFTRRFEYINQLFGGNTELFMEFLDEMGYSRDTAHAMEIFDKHYNEKNWQRRQESAMEFKRLLQRSC